MPKFIQCQITQTTHRTSQGRLGLAEKMAQGGQMRQTRNTASPNRPNAATVLYRHELLQVFRKGVRESAQGGNQLMA